MYRCKKCNKITPPKKPTLYLYEYRERIYPPVPLKRKETRRRSHDNNYGEHDASESFEKTRNEKPRTPTKGFEIVREIAVCAGCFLDDKEAKEKAAKEASLAVLAQRMTG
jgi:hypothetical protein